MKKFKLIILYALVALIFASCSDSDERANLTFEKSEYTVMNNTTYSLQIKSGNGDYSVTPEDVDIIEIVTISGEYNYINIWGLKNGKTTISIKDNLTGQNVKLNITVVDAHLPIWIGDISSLVSIENTDQKKMIENDILNNSLMQRSNILLLKRDKEKRFYLFNSRDDANENKVKTSGIYEFVIKDYKCCLILRYYQNGNISKEQELLLSSLGSGFVIISNFFDLNWVKTRELNETSPVVLGLSEDLTDTYKINNPTLTNAILDIKTEVLPCYDIIPRLIELPE